MGIDQDIGDEDVEKEPLDPALSEKALDDVKAAVRGNGLKPEAVALAGCAGEVLNFEARTIFKIEAPVIEKRMNGKEQGESAGSYTDARQKIKAAIERITFDRDVWKQTVAMLKKRKDTGFAVPDLIIRLDRLDRRFVVHEICGPCNGLGNIPCATCKGKKEIVCVRCHGQRDIQCQACHGTQFIQTAQGRQQCTSCNGRGRKGCTMCHQKGEVPCPKCRKTGKRPCQPCSGTGWHSQLFLMSVRAKGRFEYDRAALPEEIPPLIDFYGPVLVTGEHALVRIIDELKKEEELSKAAKPDEYVVPYHVKLPWGDIGFSLGKQRIDGKLFGYNALLVSMPPFFEKVLRGPLSLLAQASRGQGNVAASLQKAIRARAVRDVLLLAARNAPRKTSEMLHEKYPFGFDSATLDLMAEQAVQALKRVTEKSRLTGLAMGAALAAALDLAYFIGPLRGELTGATNNSVPGIVFDLGVLLLGGAAVSAVIQIGAAKALKRALGQLTGKASVAPGVVPALLWGFPCAALVFVLALVMTVATGAEVPDWLAALMEPPTAKK